MGAIGLENIGQGGYKFVKNLPEQTQKLLRQNKSLRNELVAKYLEWQTLITKIDDLTDAEKQLIAQQEKVWKALGVAEDFGIANKIKNLLKNNEFKAIYDDFVNGKIARKFAKELSLEEEVVLKFYTNKSYYKFNQALIKGNKTDDIIEIENLLNNTLDKIPSSSGTYYRGIGKEEIEMLEKLKVGDEITYKNFLSTTSEKEKAIDFYYSNLKETGKGALVDIISTNGKRIDTFSDVTEWEMLYKSNSKFELIKTIENYILNIDEVALEGAKPIKTTKFIIKEK